MSTLTSPWHPADRTLLGVTLVLCALGLIMIYSASTILAMQLYGDFYFFVKRQVIWLAAGLAALYGLSRYPYPQLKRWVMPLLVVSVGLLLLVKFTALGKTVGGARRWLALGPLFFQPAEMLKLVLVIYLADVLVRKQALLSSFRQAAAPAGHRRTGGSAALAAGSGNGLYPRHGLRGHALCGRSPFQTFTGAGRGGLAGLGFSDHAGGVSPPALGRVFRPLAGRFGKGISNGTILSGLGQRRFVGQRFV
jgi:hypothetical protein